MKHHKKSPTHKNTSLLQSFRFAAAGVWFALRYERNFRIHTVAAGLVLYFALTYYQLPPGQWVGLLLTIGFVLVSELINTAIENTVDLATPDYNLLAKQAKDVAAGAVFMSALCSVGVGIALFWQPPLLRQIISDMKSRWLLWLVILLACLAYIQLPTYFQSATPNSREEL